jgi:hypothetical protein
MRRLLEAAAGHRLEALVVVSPSSPVSARASYSPCGGLTWTLTPPRSARHSLEEIDGRLSLKEPKSGKSRRVDLPPLAVSALWRQAIANASRGPPGRPGLLRHARRLAPEE